MNRMLVLLALAALAGAAIATDAQAVEFSFAGDSLTGRVYNSATGRGVPGLAVRLTAPRSRNLPAKITLTTLDGRFAFRQVEAGRYLLEIRRGTVLLSRREIDTANAATYTISLRPVRP